MKKSIKELQGFVVPTQQVTKVNQSQVKGGFIVIDDIDGF